MCSKLVVDSHREARVFMRSNKPCIGRLAQGLLLRIKTYKNIFLLGRAASTLPSASITTTGGDGVNTGKASLRIDEFITSFA